MNKKQTYLITGATGFLGRHMLESLRRNAPKAHLLVLVRSHASWEKQPWMKELGDIEVVTGPLYPSDAWKNDPRLTHLDGIFHLAADVKHSRREVTDMVSTNIEGTLSMVRLAAEKKCRLLFVSSSGTVSCAPRPGQGKNEDAPFCEDIVRNWPYYASKVKAEKDARHLAQELGVTFIVFRPPVLLGPGDHRFRSTSTVLRLLRGKLPFILDGGMHFVDIRDAADAMVRAMQIEKPKPVYHLTGKVCTLDEFFRMTAKQANLKPSWLKLPGNMLWYLAMANEKSGLLLHVIPDPVVIEMAAHHWDVESRHAETDLGFRTRAHEETLADTVKWMRANHPELSE